MGIPRAGSSPVAVELRVGKEAIRPFDGSDGARLGPRAAEFMADITLDVVTNIELGSASHVIERSKAQLTSDGFSSGGALDDQVPAGSDTPIECDVAMEVSRCALMFSMSLAMHAVRIPRAGVPSVAVGLCRDTEAISPLDPEVVPLVHGLSPMLPWWCSKVISRQIEAARDLTEIGCLYSLLELRARVLYEVISFLAYAFRKYLLRQALGSGSRLRWCWSLFFGLSPPCIYL